MDKKRMEKSYVFLEIFNEAQRKIARQLPLSLILGEGTKINMFLILRQRSETFNRTTLFGIMPLWLPLAWGYGFVAIKRTVRIIGD